MSTEVGMEESSRNGSPRIDPAVVASPAGANAAENSKTNASVEEWRQYVNSLIAAEISSFSKYYDELFQWQPRSNDTGILLDRVENSHKSIVREFSELPDRSADKNKRSIVLLNGNINHDYNIQQTLSSLKPKLSRNSRVVLVAYNPYLRWLYELANRFGFRKGEQPDTFLTQNDLQSIAKLSGYEVVRVRLSAYVPLPLKGLGNFINRLMPAIPLARWLGLAAVIVLRPIIAEKSKPSLSIVIPARNEKGNIENALKRMPSFGGAKREIIFVEGHSSDGTWEEINRVASIYKDRFDIKTYQQTGKGKSDAVRLGFSHASCDLLTILDADLTMPPELLESFYNAYCEGLSDFVNGSRLVYPMEGNAMRFLNRLGNIFFAKALSLVLGVNLGDSLCGTKLLSRNDYERMTAWRNDFGDFDPFGDFELLFPAAILCLGIVDVAIRYRDRVYGSTNIRRFYHGWMLLRMTVIGLLRIRTGRVANSN